MTNYDKDGKEIGLLRWCELLDNDDYRTIENTTAGGVTISTVWIGLDHSLGNSPPLIFESMSFGLGEQREIQQHYATIEEARLGHAALVKEHISVIDKLAAVINHPDKGREDQTPR